MNGLMELARDEAVLWYLMRGAGIVLLVLLTASVVLGTLASAAPPVKTETRDSVVVPRFAVQTVHRDLSVVSLVLLAVHVVSATLHTFVDIRWIDAFVPFVGPYEPLWIGLGTVSLDLLVVASVAAAVRERLGSRTWRAVHVLTYVAWVTAVIHSLGIGTDRNEPWAVGAGAGCIVAFAVAGVARLVSLRRSGDIVASARRGAA